MSNQTQIITTVAALTALIAPMPAAAITALALINVVCDIQEGANWKKSLLGSFVYSFRGARAQKSA